MGMEEMDCIKSKCLFAVLCLPIFGVEAHVLARLLELAAHAAGQLHQCLDVRYAQHGLERDVLCGHFLWA